MSPAGPFRLVTVNTAPDRARRLIGRVVADVSEQYTIIHAANAASTSLSRSAVFRFISIFLLSLVHLPPLPLTSPGQHHRGNCGNLT
jgi:hypothetical protein